MPVRVEPSQAIDVRATSDGVMLTIKGCLDEATGEVLVQAATTVLANGAERVEIDLCALTGFTDDGACALAACRDICANVPAELQYTTGQGPGRDALLVAFADC